jgi:hypothetical protein
VKNDAREPVIVTEVANGAATAKKAVKGGVGNGGHDGRGAAVYENAFVCNRSGRTAGQNNGKQNGESQKKGRNIRYAQSYPKPPSNPFHNSARLFLTADR